MRKLLLLLTGICLVGILHTRAQIAYTDISPDTTVNSWDAYSFSLNQSPLQLVIIWFHPWGPNEVVVQTLLSDCEILWDASGTYPAKLNAGDAISSAGVWREGDYDTLNVGGAGNWATDATDKYLAYRFGGTGHWHYGWLRMDVDATPSQFTVKDRAHQLQENTPIDAGQTSATGIYETSKGQPTVFAAGKIIHVHAMITNTPYGMDVYNSHGQLVLSRTLSNESAIDMQNYPEGIYIVRLTYASSVYYQKAMLR